jgi:hypothetical protein
MMSDPLQNNNDNQSEQSSNSTSFKSFKDDDLDDSRNNVNYDLYQILKEKGIGNNKVIFHQRLKKLIIKKGGIYVPRFIITVDEQIIESEFNKPQDFKLLFGIDNLLVQHL